MSTTRDPGVKIDPFELGYREVEDSDGRTRRVPLTEFDLLHPLEDDVIVQLPSHVDDTRYLMAAFRERLVGRADVFVSCDLRIDFNIPGKEPYTPDVTVILGIDPAYNSATLNLAKFGARAAIVVELTSPSTRRNDLVPKVAGYAQAGVPTYIIVDARERKGGRTIQLIGHLLADGAYERIAPDELGRLWLGEPLNLWLTTADGRPLCLDGDTGEPIADYHEVQEARREAEARAAAAEARVDAEATRAAAAEARVDAEATRAAAAEARVDAEATRAAAAEARVDAEVEARLAAEARAAEVETRLREFEAELARLRGEG